ncbi:MAG: hypothetical protein M1821_004297 [Bathelium mastoideum]|nr:MAG: hypothetical protein M1821_004297 [Bathelium mastoideum]
MSIFGRIASAFKPPRVCVDGDSSHANATSTTNSATPDIQTDRQEDDRAKVDGTSESPRSSSPSSQQNTTDNTDIIDRQLRALACKKAASAPKRGSRIHGSPTPRSRTNSMHSSFSDQQDGSSGEGLDKTDRMLNALIKKKMPSKVPERDKRDVGSPSGRPT